MGVLGAGARLAAVCGVTRELDRASYYGENGADYPDNSFSLRYRTHRPGDDARRGPAGRHHPCPRLRACATELATTTAGLPGWARPERFSCHNLAYHGSRDEVGRSWTRRITLAPAGQTPMEGIPPRTSSTQSVRGTRESPRAPAGSGMDPALRWRRCYTGIINGIDTDPEPGQGPTSFQLFARPAWARLPQSHLCRAGLGSRRTARHGQSLDPMKGFDLSGCRAAVARPTGRGYACCTGAHAPWLGCAVWLLGIHRESRWREVRPAPRPPDVCRRHGFPMPSVRASGQGQMIAMRCGRSQSSAPLAGWLIR